METPMEEPINPALIEKEREDPNLNNPNRAPLEPDAHDPFATPIGADDMPVQHPTPGGVPPAPVTDQ